MRKQKELRFDAGTLSDSIPKIEGKNSYLNGIIQSIVRGNYTEVECRIREKGVPKMNHERRERTLKVAARQAGIVALETAHWGKFSRITQRFKLGDVEIKKLIKKARKHSARNGRYGVAAVLGFALYDDQIL
jgi:hypothetical protein